MRQRFGIISSVILFFYFLSIGVFAQPADITIWFTIDDLVIQGNVKEIEIERVFSSFEDETWTVKSTTTWSRKYDENRRIIEEIEWSDRGDPKYFKFPHLAKYTYDQEGRETSYLQTDSKGDVVLHRERKYDELGREIYYRESETGNVYDITETVYNSDGQLYEAYTTFDDRVVAQKLNALHPKAKGPFDIRTEIWTYDDNGYLLTQTRFVEGEVKFIKTFNVSGKMISWIINDTDSIKTHNYEYNEHQKLSREEYIERPLYLRLQDQKIMTTLFEYDQYGNTTNIHQTIDHKDSVTPSLSYSKEIPFRVCDQEYDQIGNVIKRECFETLTYEEQRKIVTTYKITYHE